jgi:hypothetical protein
MKNQPGYVVCTGMRKILCVAETGITCPGDEVYLLEVCREKQKVGQGHF